MPRSFALGGRFEKLIERLVKKGRYNNASEVVREGLRLVEDRERQREKATVDLRMLVEESERGGGASPAEDVRKRLLKHIERVANKR